MKGGVILGKIIFIGGRIGGRKMLTIIDVANWFINKANSEEERFVTPLKLQKLCYYAQAWHYTWEGERIFPEDFEAWAHGPANHELFKRFRSYGYHVIDEVSEPFNEDGFCDNVIETLEAVWETYGVYDGKYLEELTHSESPWIKARGNCGPGEYCNEIIPLDSMKEYYSSL